MTDDDDATDVRLRERAERWRHDAPPIPDVDDALRRARSRTRRPHVLLQVAAVAVLVLVISVGAVVLARHASNSRHQPARPRVSSATLAKLTRVATRFAQNDKNPAQVRARAVSSNQGRADQVLDGGHNMNEAENQRGVWVVQLRGHFTCGCKGPPVSTRGGVRTGTVLTVVVNQTDFEVSTYIFGGRASDLSKLGAVFDVPIRDVPNPSPTTPTATPMVTFARTLGGDRFVFAIGTGPDGAAGSHLVVTDASGNNPRDIGPRLPANYQPDSLFFLDAQHGWFLAYDGATIQDRLYRTGDGGKTWQFFAAPGHNASGGSNTAVDFVNPQDGWLTSIEPNGPREALMHTTDGGAHWRSVASLGGPERWTLPRTGQVNFTPDGSRGWLGDLDGNDWPLEYTTDHGRHWHAVRALGAGQYHSVGLPSIFGSTLIVSVADFTGGADSTDLSTYVSSDGGNSWNRTGRFRIASEGVQVSAVFPTATSGWAVTTGGSTNRLSIRRTTDQGRSWSTITPPKVSRSGTPAITAIDANHAVLTGLGGNGDEVYATSNGGQSWRRIDQQLIR